jgi:DNA polymerase III epsilon subunit-like protein
MAYTKNNIVVIDFETGSLNPHRTQPIQLAAIMLDLKKLEMIPGSEFNAEIKPVINAEELEKQGLDALEDGALKVNKKNVESLLKAKSADVVWNEFQAYVSNYKTSKSDKGSPIVCGFNNNRFDDIILKRLGMKYGGFNKDKEKWEILHPDQNIDVFKYCWMWLESGELESLSLDTLRGYFGISKDGAHDALVDVLDTAEIFVRFMRLTRHLNERIKFAGSCKDRIIKRGHTT